MNNVPTSPSELIEVAKLGRSVGLDGGMKCQLLTDFPEIFQNGHFFFVFSPIKRSNIPLTLKKFLPQKQIIQFDQITNPEYAKHFTNQILYATLEDTRKFCHLAKEEFFWFDIIGCSVIESDKTLGIVKDILRIANTDYLVIKTHQSLTPPHSKEFLLPYLQHFILYADPLKKIITTQNAKAILETS
ncbi:ribosome maturation factor RimM [Helicobacter mustelae]|uniref:Ribosome maturation factor RimM n=1 Tax=Helicobacter mustelae (strain ATCC 43772 / CCUG 25715 / CIP 103759 / LMG 18044 / NCTC 12198 / R85-136P) TaxID=679897 RepID=D3UGH8_HELM1|nr:ribosome maturation factor RimM [Helicobacter mustelae]CBG39599.1 putative 16S rRNA processing protein [Helicobacter mustelae 12198]SQH71111.1 16S rRNA processing protein [Helicobacter mustelae]STP12239.1 16S rRNA processing protein [Helicobacter mustelae]